MDIAANLSKDETITNNSVSVDEYKAMQAIKKQYFPSDKSDDASTAVDAIVDIVSKANGFTVFNFDTDKEIKEGYAITIAPINQRNNNKTEVIGVIIGAVPTYEIIMGLPAGIEFIKELVNNAILIKLINASRLNPKTNEIPATRPYAVEDFITSNRSEGVLVAYRKLASRAINALKSKGVTNLTDAVFRQCLQSTVYAKTTMADIPQGVWVKVISSMIVLAEKENMIPGMLVEWLETRDTAGMPDIKEVDYEGLKDLEL